MKNWGNCLMFRTTFSKSLRQSHIFNLKKCFRKILERTKLLPKSTRMDNLLAFLWSFEDPRNVRCVYTQWSSTDLFLNVLLLLTARADCFALASHLICYEF